MTYINVEHRGYSCLISIDDRVFFDYLTGVSITGEVKLKSEVLNCKSDVLDRMDFDIIKEIYIKYFKMAVDKKIEHEYKS